MVKAIKLALLALLLVASEAFAQFCPGLPPWVFDDVPSTHPFCTDITWIAQRGVTLGCSAIDANHRLYCPDSEVTRAEMAAFMHRLGDALFPLTCAAGQVMKWNGLAWACASDNIGGGGGGGTVTSVAAGIGLQASPNPIIGAGVIDVAPAYRLPQACAANQIAKWNGSAWLCAADAAGIGTVTSLTAGAGITLTPNPIVASGTVAADTAYLQRRVTTSCGAGRSISTINADGSVVCEIDDGTNAFEQGGNAFNATAVLGTTDARPLEVIVDGQRALHLLYVDNSGPIPASINTTGGHPDNRIARTCSGFGCSIGNTDPVRGGTIAGGGAIGSPNRVTDSWGFVGGGADNLAGNDNSVHNDAQFAAVVGGRANTASGPHSFVGGGGNNVASGTLAAIPGGIGNYALGYSSFAAGNSAYANADGCFVWADSSGDIASCNTPNQFLARAAGGFQLRVDVALNKGCAIAAISGDLSCASSRDVKEGFTNVDPLAILDRVVMMPISTWRYRGETSGAIHLGPMAEDFREALGLGTSSREIGMLDAQGAALAAIQGLNAKLEARDKVIDTQGREIAELRRAVEDLLVRNTQRH
jgi:hypothetical protein